jgi:hypothetical protein
MDFLGLDNKDVRMFVEEGLPIEHVSIASTVVA